MASVATDLMAALQEINSTMGIPLEDLLASVESALAEAYQRAFEPARPVTVTLDRESAEIHVMSTELAEDGALTAVELPSDDFKRMAAQTARSAVMRHIRDLERDKALRDVSERRGQLASGIIDRVERGTVYLDMGKAEGIMPPEEQIPGEEMRPGRPLTVVILEPKPSWRQAQVRVSRASRIFVQKLLEAEVPEIAGGSVQVMGIAREAGLRTKIAVFSSQPGIDPVGACVGPKGIRHRSLLAELDREHVDIIPWSAEPEAFVASALGPATVVAVHVDAETRTANVRVPKDQLSLAIGKDGQNARLAAKLTGWRIDIKAAEEPPAPS